MSTFEQELNIRKLRRNGIINSMKPHPTVIKLCDKNFIVQEMSLFYRLYQSISTTYRKRGMWTDNEATVSLIKTSSA